MEGMRKSSDPLSRRLRYAALDRGRDGGERVDDYILDADGVIDLREFDRVDSDVSIASPAAALATIRGQLGDAAEVSDLYDESEPEQPRWRFRRRGHRTTTEPPPTARATTPPGPDPVDETTEPDLDLRDDERPTANCPRCGERGQRDLHDRVSQVDFFSCDVCTHMWQRDHR